MNLEASFRLARPHSRRFNHRTTHQPKRLIGSFSSNSTSTSRSSSRICSMAEDRGCLQHLTHAFLEPEHVDRRDATPEATPPELHAPCTTTTMACRAALVSLTLPALLWHEQADAAVQRLWDTMRASPFVQWDTFEPTVVVLTFMVSMAAFWLLDVPLKRHTARWRLSTDDDMGAWHWRNVAERLRGETLLYIAPLAAFDLLLPRRHLPEVAPSLGSLCIEVLLALALYDLLFTLGHLLCHRLPWLYRLAHRKHHSLAVVRAIETVRLSPGEEALDVACSIAALNLLGCHPLSRAVYDMLIVYLLTELHSGYSMPWMLQDVVPFGWWGGSRRHAEHHRYGNVYFQKFFTYLDNGLGYVRSQSLAAEGAPEAGKDTCQAKSG